MVFFNVLLKTTGFLFGVLIFIVLVNIILLLVPETKKSDFSFTEGDKNSLNIIATLKLNGPIINSQSNFLNENINTIINPKIVKQKLESLKRNNPKILIVNINSPGGTVNATTELFKIFQEYKKSKNIKIYFITQELLASGGYWVATVGDKIYGGYGSIIGSIGVTGPSWYYYNKPTSISSGIFGSKIETKNGIEVFNQSAGSSKDLFNPFRRPNNDEILHLQSIIDEIYIDFVQQVSKSRKIEINILKKEIGALIYSSKQAKDNFLIDETIDYYNLIKKIAKEENYTNYKIIENKDSYGILNKFFYQFQNSTNLVCNKLKNSFNSIMPIYFENC